MGWKNIVNDDGGSAKKAIKTTVRVFMNNQ